MSKLSRNVCSWLNFVINSDCWRNALIEHSIEVNCTILKEKMNRYFQIIMEMVFVLINCVTCILRLCNLNAVFVRKVQLQIYNERFTWKSLRILQCHGKHGHKNFAINFQVRLSSTSHFVSFNYYSKLLLCDNQANLFCR